MKLLTVVSALTTLFATTAAFACPDLSGKYTASLADGQATLAATLTQTGCESLQMDGELTAGGETQKVSSTTKTDGIFRQDGASPSSTMNLFTETSMISETVMFEANDGQTVLKSIKSIATLDEKGNIVITNENYDAQGNLTSTEKMLFTRI